MRTSKPLFWLSFFLIILVVMPAYAQDAVRDVIDRAAAQQSAEQSEAETAPEEGQIEGQAETQSDIGLQLEMDEEDELDAEMIDMPVVKLQSLDKITARTMTFEANVGSTVKFGSLYIKVQACRKAPPIEQPESSAFMQIWEVDNNDEAAWIFSGWMFASSPGLSSMDHAIYDVWVLDCLEKKSPQQAQAKQEEEERGEGEIDEQEAPAQPVIETAE